MFSVFGLILVLIIRAKSDVQENLQNNNGWKPLTSEEVFNFHGKFTQTAHPITSTLHWSSILPAEEKLINIKQNRDVEPQEINAEFTRNIDYVDIDDKPNQISLTDKKQNIVLQYLSSIDTKMHKPLLEHRRQAKNIIENQESSDINTFQTLKKYEDIAKSNMHEKLLMKETINKDEKSNVYEVTEVSDSPEINYSLHIDQREINENKPYFESDVKNVMEKNLSKILLNILGNYNIRTNDELTNYALSRNKHNSNMHKQKYGYIAPIRTQPIRNSENYLPLDPLLAVFLSNYGFYLPGYYGFPGKYYNIYGYLASNNIHNNKPFGAYKIYSDTDSSH